MSCVNAVLIGLLSSIVLAVEGHILDSCPIKVEPVGCYRDSAQRTLPIEFLNARDTSRSIYAGYSIDWKNWSTYLPKFICDCAKLAYNKGYKVMGVQFYGECWGGKNGHLDYAKQGKAESCVQDSWAKCNKREKACSGERWSNYIYKVAPLGCDTHFEPVGCFKDKQNVPRPLPDYILNERDYRHGSWNGRLIEWNNWNKYIPGLICRCAAKAKALGHTTFSIQFYGECWSGKESEMNYNRDGKSERCWAEDFKSCPYNSYNCVGRDYANRVYRLRTAPSVSKDATLNNDQIMNHSYEEKTSS